MRLANAECAYSVEFMCRKLGVSKSGYYDWRDRPDSATAQRRGELRLLIKKAFDISDGTYGYRRVHAQLLRWDRPASPELVRQLMRQLGLVPCQPRPKRWSLTQAAPGPVPDLVRRDFTAEAPGEKLVGDITYIPTGEGWLYLATVIDCCTREVIGYAMDDHYQTPLISRAIRNAARNRKLVNGAILHSDRGSNGGFNRSLQHLVPGGVDGRASRVDGGVDRAVTDEVSGCAGAPTGGRTSVLARDREGAARRGGGSCSRRIAGSGLQVVPARWRHATDGSCPAVRPVPVLSRA
jgi:putative transposase